MIKSVSMGTTYKNNWRKEIFKNNMWGNICKAEVDENGTWNCFSHKYFRLCFHVVNLPSLEKSKHDIALKCTLIWTNVLAPVALSAPNWKNGGKKERNSVQICQILISLFNSLIIPIPHAFRCSISIFKWTIRWKL